MQVKRFILIAAALLPAAFAQTSSDCNPLKGCFKDDPALGTTYVWDYTKNHGEAPRFDIVSSASRISYQNDGMHMSVTMKGDSPTLQSQFYIFWGRAEIVMKAGPGAGIVSSLVFQSDALDEIDVEFIGNQPGNVQTNIFSKGNQDVHIYGANTGVADTVGVFHKYTVDWTPQQITWSIDGNVVRTLSRAELGENVYPQTPMQIKFGPWAAGDPSNAPGTIEWAGGPIDYSLAPFDMVVASLVITDYSAGATKYRYRDSSGSAASIEITGGGNVNPPPPVQEPSSSAPPPPPPTTTSTPPPPPTTTSSKPPPPPPTTTSTPPPPPPPPSTTTSSKSTPPPPPPPPPPTATSEPTSTSESTTSTTEEPETTTSKLNIPTKIITTSSSPATTSSKPPPPPKPTTTSSEEEETTTSVEEETSTSYRPTKSTFSIETTKASTSSEPTERSEETTLATIVTTQSTNTRLPTNSDVPNSGSSIRTASPLIVAIVALFVLF